MGQWSFHTLAEASMGTLRELLTTRPAPAIESIRGWEFRGWNVLPVYGVPLFWAMGNMRFIKFFDHEGEGGNFKVSRGGNRAPWRAVPSDARPLVQGYYTVCEPGTKAVATDYPQALFLDYDREPNTLFTGRYLRDYLVQVDDDNPDLLLGSGILVLGPLRSEGFFVLERLQPLRERPGR